MPLLNENLAAPGPRHANFTSWRKIRIDAGVTLGKFTGFDLYAGRGMSPWWAFIQPGPVCDPGVLSIIAQLRAANVPLARAVRDAYAVMFEWNTLGDTQNGFLKLQQITLSKPVFGFHGRIAPVLGNREPLVYPLKDQTRFTGGAYQIFIPGLTSEHAIGTRIVLVA